MSLETTAGDAKMKLSTPNEEDDSDYDSMFGDDSSSDDEEKQEKVPSPSSSTSIVQVTTEKEGIEDDDNLKEYKNENQRQQLDNNNCAPILNISKSNQSKKIPRKNAALSSSGSNNNSIRKKRKLSPSTLSKLSSSQYGGGGSLSHDTTTSPSFDIDTYNYSPSFDDFGSSVLTTDKALVSASTSASSSASVSRTTHGSSSSSSIVTHKNPKQQIPLLRPDQYPSFGMDEFWRTFRAWNFIHDLNQSIKKQQQQQHQQENKEKIEPPLPEDFHCHEQYVALWSPLLLREIKAQIISDVTSLKSSSVPLSKFAQSVNVTVKNSGSSRSGEENYSDFLTLNISAQAQDPAGGKGGGQRYGGGGGGAQGRNAKMVQHHASRNEFVQNEMVLLITEPSFLDQACKGSLKVDSSAESGKKSSYCMMTLLSNASQFAKGRLGVVGIVKQRSKSLKSGLIVQISKRLLKSSAPETFGSCLLRLGHCVTGMSFHI